MKWLALIAFLFIQPGDTIHQAPLKDTVIIGQMITVQKDIDSIRVYLNEMINQLNDTTSGAH